MGWNSSYLGGNVVSSYLHIDNLRMDLLAGKFWDSGATKYLQASHDGTNGKLVSSAGRLDLTSGTQFTRIYEVTGAHYFEVGVATAGTGTTIYSDAGTLNISGASGQTHCYTAGTPYEFLIVNANDTEFMGLAIDVTAHTDVAGWLRTTHNTKPMGIAPDSKRVRLYDPGTAAGAASVVLEFWDVSKGAWWKAYLDNGAWVIAAV